MTSRKHFYNLREGETALLLGNGPSLNNLTTGLLCSYASIGSNTLFKSGFVPTTVDSRVTRELGDENNTIFGYMPKFVPAPNLEDW